MKQHSFRKGDLVVCKGYGWRGVFQEIAKKHGDAHFLGGNIPCVCNISELQHDRDFQAGDWVRYEAVEPHKEGYDAADGKVGKIISISKEFAETVGELSQTRFIGNLVKIAPPTEEKMESVEKFKVDDCVVYNYINDDAKKITIEHDQWGRVEGVRRNIGPCRPFSVMWEKDGACYAEFHGWREVKPKRWVPVPVNIICLSRCYANGICFDLPPGHRWKTVEIEKEVEG